MTDITKDSNNLILCNKPEECLESDLQIFTSILHAVNLVSPAKLDKKISDAKILLFYKKDNNIKGIAGIKRPDKQYKDKLFEKAKAQINADVFEYELGWFFIDRFERGKGIANILAEKALSFIPDSPVYATTKISNISMQTVLEKQGLKRTGEPYRSLIGDYENVLFIKK